MRLRGVAWFSARVGTACIVAGGALALAATGTAVAATPSASHSVSGSAIDISCLTTSRCVSVGVGMTKGTGHGNVATLFHGKQTHNTFVDSSELLQSISCPSKAGCWALGPQDSGNNLVLVRINRSGRVAKSIRVREPAGADLGHLSCVSMTSCELAGEVFGSSVEAQTGWWNGKKLARLHKVKFLSGEASEEINNISCWRTSCTIVGAAYVGSVTADKADGLLLTTSRGKPGRWRTSAGDFLNGVSCVSRNRCYADGFGTGSVAGVLITVNHGVASDRRTASPEDFEAIACDGSKCTAAGQQLDNSVKTKFEGVLARVSAGKFTGSPQLVPASGGFQAVARVGSSFAAIGQGQGTSGSEVTTG